MAPQPTWAEDSSELVAPLTATPPPPTPMWRTRIVKVIKGLCLFGAVVSTSIGCYGFWFSWHTYHKGRQVDPVLWLISFYVAAFGVATSLAELDAAIIFGRFPFLASRFGRGATYVFIGSLAFVQGIQFNRKFGSPYFMIVGGYEMAAGVSLAASYACVGTGGAGEYNVYRPPAESAVV
ncbi:hypothetical protein CTAYLR_006808 [Chrysophaeum taylorii]|uniref:Uncharacterized protein n=1 Tax=Chrysophaeum taylorii TaxID=2483200 RepID=A0AAD7UC14_9STRA|nr:hypothetical protein CTAYLR_006808 [Chrysophaeum taylorii]